VNVLLTTVDGVSQVAQALEKGIADIIKGAVSAAGEVSEDVLLILKATVKGIVKGASEVGANVGKTAVIATQ